MPAYTAKSGTVPVNLRCDPREKAALQIAAAKADTDASKLVRLYIRKIGENIPEEEIDAFLKAQRKKSRKRKPRAVKAEPKEVEKSDLPKGLEELITEAPEEAIGDKLDDNGNDDDGYWG